MDVHQLMTAMASEVHAVDSPPEAIERIAHYARIAVDATDSGIMLGKARGKVETPAGTSDNVTKAHTMQADLDEGPCLDAIRGDQDAYVSGDVLNDDRWPAWGPAVAELGYRSVVSICLQTADRKYGSLNAYSGDTDAFGQEDVQVMELLAVHASLAYKAIETEHQLHAALDSRTTIGQAQGVLMAVYDIDAETSFQYLRRLSSNSNIRLVEVCKDVIAQRHELRKNID